MKKKVFCLFFKEKMLPTFVLKMEHEKLQQD